MMRHFARWAVLLLAGFSAISSAAQLAIPPKGDVLIKNATLLTVTHGRVEHGSVYVKDGKIAAFGAKVDAPAGATVVDAGGKYVTPGIIDSHSHMALDSDINEATSPVVPHMMMRDAFVYDDKQIYRALAGGVTTALLLHGSADMIGGQAVVIKTKYGMEKEQMIFPNAPQSIKFASGENPKRDLKLEALADVLRGKMLVQIHCYRADELLTEMAMAKEFGYKVRAFHHALEAYKVADKLAENGVAIATFSDWWGYKYEAWDAIPWNAVISMRKGVKVAIKSDSDDFVRRLNQEAAKTMRYGGATEDEAMKMITINPAWIIGVDDKVGSIDIGKDGDLVLWSDYPLSSFAVPERVWIDGVEFFDRSKAGLGMPQMKEAQ